MKELGRKRQLYCGWKNCENRGNGEGNQRAPEQTRILNPKFASLQFRAVVKLFAISIYLQTKTISLLL